MPPSHVNLPLRPRYDAVVLGSGLGGATAALRLGQRGLSVLLVEQGGFLGEDAPPDPSMTSQYIIDAVKSRDAPLHFVGGQTKFFGAAFYRFREADFAEVRHEAGVSPAWPLSYAELEPYYGEAEALYKIHGSPEGDPTEPPRSTPYPHPPVPYDPRVAVFAERLSRIGAQISAIPRAVDYGEGGRCINCAACDAFFCVRDGKMDADVAAVRPALLTGKVQLMTHTRCETVLLSDDGRLAVGVRLVTPEGPADVAAGAVISAAGLAGTVELFLRSRTKDHPEGLGADSGNLGRNLGGHSTGMIFPLMSLKTLPPVQTKTFAMNENYLGAPNWAFPLGVVQLAGQMPFWREASRIIRPIAKLVSEHCFTLFYMTETPPTHEAGFVIKGDRVAGKIEPPHSLKSFRRLRAQTVGRLLRAGYLALARTRPPYLWHEVGTARMGSDPKTSVVDAFGEVHGIKGLFVADASVLPSAGAVNTGLTIAALALRTADHIAARRHRRKDALELESPAEG